MIQDILRDNTNAHRFAVIEDGRQIHYEEILRSANAVQSFFAHAHRSEPAAILLPNGCDFISAFLGVLKAGMVAFPLHTQLKKSEIARLLNHTATKSVITSRAYRPLLEGIKVEYADSLRILYTEELPSLPPTQSSPVRVSPDEPRVLICTSGTVGMPKIVQLSARNLFTSLRGYLDKMHFTELELEATRYFLAAPFCSAYGIMIITACLTMGFPLAFTDGVFTLDGFFKAVERDRITHYEGGGIVLQLMEKMFGRPVGYDISTLGFFGFGGSPVSAKTIQAVQRAYPGIEFLQGYGMTESSPLITKHERGVPVRPASVGTAIDGVTIEVKTPDGITSSPYIRGEVLVKGANVMLGYHSNEAQTNQIIADGYLHTGDIGYLDEYGYLYLCGRKKNIILIRGYTVYPEEIEGCLMDSGLVEHCFVYGKADEEGQETIIADVVPLYGAKTLPKICAYCRENLSGYKQPGQYCLRDEIPKNLSGKTKRHGK